MAQCKAKRRLTEEQCKLHATPGREVCYLHGGKTPRGIASPHFITGRHSKDIPTRLAAKYQEAIEDPNLLVLRDEVALLDARLGDLVKRVDTGEAGSVWAALRQQFGKLLEAIHGGDMQVVLLAVEDINGIIMRGLSDYAAWHEIAQTIEQRRRLVESERKRLLELQQFVTVEKLMAFMGQIVSIINQRVDDPDIRREISSDIDRIQLKEG